MTKQGEEVWRNLVDPIGSRNAQIYELRSELKSLLALVDALIDDRIDIKDIAEEIVLIKLRNLFLNEDDSWKDVYHGPGKIPDKGGDANECENVE